MSRAGATPGEGTGEPEHLCEPLDQAVILRRCGDARAEGPCKLGIAERADDQSRLGEALERLVGTPGRPHQQERAGLPDEGEPEVLDPTGQPASLCRVGSSIGAHVPDVGAGDLGTSCALGRERAGRSQRIERPGDLRAGERVADPQRRESPGLREGADDDEVLVLGDQAGEVLAAELEVGLIDDDEARAGSADRTDGVGRNLLAGRVVGRAEPDETDSRRLGDDPVEIEPERPVRSRRYGDEFGRRVLCRDGVEGVVGARNERTVAA